VRISIFFKLVNYIRLALKENNIAMKIGQEDFAIGKQLSLSACIFFNF